MLRFIGRVAWLFLNFTLAFFAATCVGLGLAYLFMLLHRWLLSTNVREYTPILMAFAVLFAATLAASIIVASSEWSERR